MKLSLVSGADEAIVRTGCEGDVTAAVMVDGGADLFTDLLGEPCYERKVLVDMAKTTFIDSSGIGWLITSHKRFKENGGMLVLHSIPPRVRQALDFLRIGSIIHLASDEKAALTQALGASS